MGWLVRAKASSLPTHEALLSWGVTPSQTIERCSLPTGSKKTLLPFALHKINQRSVFQIHTEASKP
jgi:hypothetical protein